MFLKSLRLGLRQGLIFVLIFFCSFSYLYPSILEGTLVSTPSGFVPVENIGIGDVVLTRSADGGCGHTRVRAVSANTIGTVYHIKTLHDELRVSENQLIYNDSMSSWMRAKDISVGDLLLKADSECIECTAIWVAKERGVFYTISLESPHTFYVTESEILMHNFALAIPFFVGISIAFGDGVAITGMGCGVGALGVGVWKCFEKNKNRYGLIRQFFSKNAESDTQVSGKSFGGAGSGAPEEPKKNQIRKKIAETLKERRKKAIRLAKKLGFKETKDYKFNSYGEKVFKKGNRYISLDKTAHKGGFWKMFEHGERIATLSEDLTVIIGK